MEKKLAELDARGMTINERLFHIGLITEFYEAEDSGDEATMRSILGKIHITSDNIEAIIEDSRNKRSLSKD